MLDLLDAEAVGAPTAFLLRYEDTVPETEGSGTAEGCKRAMLILDTEQMNEKSGLDYPFRDWVRKLSIQGRRLLAVASGREPGHSAETHDEPEVQDRATGLIL